MIQSFGNQLASDLFDDKSSKVVRFFPSDLRRRARRKLLYLHEAAVLQDLKVPPGNRLEQLKGNKKDFFSIRVNDQWRIIFKWKESNAYEVQIIDYHK